jgi:hypothetical protein
MSALILYVDRQCRECTKKRISDDILRSVELTADGGFVFPGYYSGMFPYSYLTKIGGNNTVIVGGEYDSVCQTTVIFALGHHFE